jgi:membrane-associated protease RseP (regulator of RpoE activity)
LPDVDDISKGREQFQFRPFNIQLQKVNRFEVLFGKELLERDDRDRYRIRVIPVG